MNEDAEQHLRTITKVTISALEEISGFPCACTSGHKCQTCLAEQALKAIFLRKPSGESSAPPATSSGPDTNKPLGTQQKTGE